MAKLITLFFILIAIQACLLIYAPQPAQSTSIWTFVTNIDNWNSLTFILTLVAIAAGIGLVGVAAGTIFGFKTDFLMLAPAIGGIISMGVIIINLANVVRDELISRVFTSCLLSTGTCSPANFVVAIMIGPFALYYVWTVIDWWRGKDF